MARRPYPAEGRVYLERVLASLEGWRQDLEYLVRSGVPLRAVARSFDVDANTVLGWYRGLYEPNGVYRAALRLWAQARRRGKAKEAERAGAGPAVVGGVE